MTENPYASSHVVSEPHSDAPPRIRFSAIVVGILSDFGFTFAASMVLGIIVGIQLAVAGVAPDEISERVDQMPLITYGGFLLGCFGSVLGGYVSAAFGKVWPLRHALFTGIGSLLVALPMLPFAHAGMSLLYTVSSLAVVIPLSLLGGFLYSLHGKASRTQRDNPSTT